MDDKLITLTLEPLDAQKKIAVKKAFSKMEVALDAMTIEYNEIIVQDITKEICSDAQSLRMRISKVRIDGEKWKTKEKKQYLEAGNAIQGLFNYLKKDTMDKEASLKEIEDHFQIIADLKITKTKNDRLKMLEPYAVDSTFVDLGNMTIEAWTAHFAGIVAAHEKTIEDEKKNSDEQKLKDENQRIFDERKEELLPYAQFNPFVDLYHETTVEEYDELLALMKKTKQEFDDDQADLFNENTALKEENKELKESAPEVNKFKQDIFAGFSSGAAPPIEKENLSSDKDTSLGEMLGFDIPEEKVEIAGQIISITEMPEMPTSVLDPLLSTLDNLEISEKDRLLKCAEYLKINLTHFENETAKNAVQTCINNLNGAAMIM